MTTVNTSTQVSETQVTTVVTPVKRGRGRPKGSLNKPKFNPDGTVVVKTKKIAKSFDSVLSQTEDT